MSNLLGLITAGERNVQELADPSALQRVATHISSLVEQRGIKQVVAASPAAEHIVGAALVMAAKMSRKPDATHLPDRTPAVLVIDVNLASGTVMAEMARRLRMGGAAQVDGVVLHLLGDAVGAPECGLDRLEILQPSGTFTPRAAVAR